MLMKVVTGCPDICRRSRIRKFRVSRAHVESRLTRTIAIPPYANPSCSQMLKRAGP